MICKKCGDDKPEIEFQDKVMYYYLVDGTRKKCEYKSGTCWKCHYAARKRKFFTAYLATKGVIRDI